jgi:hypothetical protein
MSTERAALSETDAVDATAARWQSESASEPMTRSLSATPTRCDLPGDGGVVVPSKLRIAIVSFGRCVPRERRFRNAPAPRSAVHSSPSRSRRRSRRRRRPSSGPLPREREREERDAALCVDRPVNRIDDDRRRPAGTEGPRPQLLGDEHEVAAALCEARDDASSAAWSIAVVSSPPSPRRSTGSRSTCVGSPRGRGGCRRRTPCTCRARTSRVEWWKTRPESGLG